MAEIGEDKRPHGESTINHHGLVEARRRPRHRKLCPYREAHGNRKSPPKWGMLRFVGRTPISYELYSRPFT